MKCEFNNLLFATRLTKLMAGDVNRPRTTQKELAEATGITRQTISQYQQGDIIPNSEKLFYISNYFNVSADYLLGITHITSVRYELTDHGSKELEKIKNNNTRNGMMLEQAIRIIEKANKVIDSILENNKRGQLQ